MSSEKVLNQLKDKKAKLKELNVMKMFDRKNKAEYQKVA